jgi:hypothetical protein
VLKIGIYEAVQDTPAQRIWRRGLMSAGLLGATDPATASDDRFERLMPHLRLSNGVARTTTRGRFAELDKTIGECLRTIFPPRSSTLLVEDWAVSSGITAAEWFTHLLADYPRLKFTASDSVLFLIEAARPEEGDRYILESDGTPIQYVRPPFVVSLTERQHWFYIVNRRLQQQALRTWNDGLAARFRMPGDWGGAVDETAGVVSSAPFVLRKLPLLHPAVQRLRSEQFQIRRHSVFEALEQPAHIIRTMNILNHAYFTEAQLRLAVSAVEASLEAGGVWIVGRTRAEHPPQHDVTVYRKQPDGWKALLRVGGGSEIEPLVNSV